MKLTLQLPGDQQLSPPSGLPSELTGGLETSGKNLLQVGFNLVFLAALTLVVIFFVYSGILWITSGGDPQKIKAAKSRMLYSIIGLLVIVSAFLIVSLITNILGVRISS